MRHPLFRAAHLSSFSTRSVGSTITNPQVYKQPSSVTRAEWQPIEENPLLIGISLCTLLRALLALRFIGAV